MNKTHPRTYVIAAFTALLSMIPIAWQIGYSTGLGNSTPTGMQTAQSETLEETKTILALAKVSSITGTTLFVSIIPLWLTSTTQSTTQQEVLTNDATVFERSIPKDSGIFLSEMNAFIAKMEQNSATSSTPSEPPIPFMFESIALADVHVGDTIFVIATENILLGRQIVAARITIESALPANALLVPSSN